ncbi:hypothetical protein LZ32DRAFT_605109 [Colletotrichum eremochloae]|nr:hypothetical protein LZ32DRAFT_605109 [Colletotrichum eremochloae]
MRIRSKSIFGPGQHNRPGGGKDPSVGSRLWENPTFGSSATPSTICKRWTRNGQAKIIIHVRILQMPLACDARTRHFEFDSSHTVQYEKWEKENPCL